MAKKAKGTVIDTSAYKYEALRIRGKDGKLHYVRGNGDAVVRALALHCIVNGKSIDQVIKANKLETANHANAGQLRMAVGGQLRGLIRNGTPVVIGDVTLKSLDQNVKLAEEPAGERPARAAKKAAPKKAKKAAKKPRAKRAPVEEAAAA